jgi:riboflavin synthase
MFTGLIEALCRVAAVQCRADSIRLNIDLGSLATRCSRGDSIAVNGACLTIAELSGSVAAFDVSSETLAVSTLGKLSTASFVNIERALKADSRFGGHFVQGHIDGTARIEKINPQNEFRIFRFAAGAELLGQMVTKGSVAVDGISLTIAKLDKTGFEAAVIPETIARTNLKNAKPGDLVNIETDLIVKVIKKQLENILPKKENMTVEKLQQLGF